MSEKKLVPTASAEKAGLTKDMKAIEVEPSERYKKAVAARERAEKSRGKGSVAVLGDEKLPEDEEEKGKTTTRATNTAAGRSQR